MKVLSTTLMVIFIVFFPYSTAANETQTVHQRQAAWSPYDLVFLKLPVESRNPNNDYPPTPWPKGSTSLPVSYVNNITGEHITFESGVLPKEHGLSPDAQYLMVQTPDFQLCQVNNVWTINFCLPVNPDKPAQVNYGGVYWASDSQSFRTGKSVKLDDIPYDPVTETTGEFATYLLNVKFDGTILEERTYEADTIQLDISHAYVRDTSLVHDLMILTIREDTTPPFPTYIIDAIAGEVLYRLPDEFGLVESRIALSPDGQKLAIANTTSPNILITTLDGHILSTIQPQSSWNGRFSSFLKWSPDGRFIFWKGGTGNPDEYMERVFEYSFQTGQVRQLPAEINEANDISISPDGKYFLLLNCQQSGSGSCSLTLVNTITGQTATLVDFSENVIMNLRYLEWLPNNWLRECSLSPNGIADLISAIQTANTTPDPDTICLAANTSYTLNAVNNGQNSLPVINSEITILGNGATIARQSGSPNFRLFEVSASGTLTLENLTLSGGSLPGESGGAVVNYGTLNVNSVTLTGNVGYTGGAIDSQTGSTTVTGSTFQNNHADYGGALDNDADSNMVVTNSTFTGNTADYDGGAIHNDGGTLTVTGSTFTSNTASRYGGALDNTGQATLSSSTFSDNSASWSGGAIRNTNILTVNNGSVLENNAATVGGNSEGWGGGVYNASGGTATLSGVTLSANDAIQGGGVRNHGSLTLNENTQLTGNSASNRGGGIYNAGGTITLTNSALLNNTATGDGGALYVTSTGSQVTITGSTVSGNTSGASGGAIRSSQSLTITDSVFSNNTATSNYGSLYLTSSSTTTAHNSCFSGNSATSVGFTGTTMQDFTGNWWGAADGPSGSGSGSGDAVNNRINFANFLTAGCPHP